MNDDMLAIARKHQRAVGDAIGFHNVEFRKGRIQDLALDLESWTRLASHPITSAEATWPRCARGRVTRGPNR
jgi:hypothetical protein